jgi:branched-chain amino acid transport system ATP-binding protein
LVQTLLDHIRRVRDEGRTIVYVEHDMDVVMSISDRVICLAEGRVIANGTPHDVANDQNVIDAYLGQRHARPA